MNKILSSELIKYSVNEKGCKLATYLCTMNSATHMQMLKHKTFNETASSKRAQSTSKQINDTYKNPFIPDIWMKTGKGMQPTKKMGYFSAKIMSAAYKSQFAMNILFAKFYEKLSISKEQLGNTLLPYNVMKVMITMPDYGAENFFSLRANKKDGAQTEIAELAALMQKQWLETEPQKLQAGEWHIPFSTHKYFNQDDVNKAVSCTAFLSYDTHERVRTKEKYKMMHDKLLEDRHMNCFSHAARATNSDEIEVKYAGFLSYRNLIERGENVY